MRIFFLLVVPKKEKKQWQVGDNSFEFKSTVNESGVVLCYVINMIIFDLEPFRRDINNGIKAKLWQDQDSSITTMLPIWCHKFDDIIPELLAGHRKVLCGKNPKMEQNWRLRKTFLMKVLPIQSIYIFKSINVTINGKICFISMNNLIKNVHKRLKPTRVLYLKGLNCTLQGALLPHKSCLTSKFRCYNFPSKCHLSTHSYTLWLFNLNLLNLDQIFIETNVQN